MVWGVENPNQNPSYLRNKPIFIARKAKENDNYYLLLKGFCIRHLYWRNKKRIAFQNRFLLLLDTFCITSLSHMSIRAPLLPPTKWHWPMKTGEIPLRGRHREINTNHVLMKSVLSQLKKYSTLLGVTTHKEGNNSV